MGIPPAADSAELKRNFLRRETWMLAWAASVQRAQIYRSGLKPESPELHAFRSSMATYVAEELLPKYLAPCEPMQHEKNLESLVAHANSIGQEVLADGGYKFGVAQKLLNLFLKYLWCLNLVAEPPHCPVDRLVLQKTSLRGKVNWTEIKTLAEYKAVIAEIDKVASAAKLSISLWELHSYARR